MMRSRFDRQLGELNRELIEMSAFCEEAIAASVKALLTGDAGVASGVPALEEEIDRRERKIEALCMRLLLLQQPVAGDLRLISAALKMITDLERIGDQAADIGEIVGFLGGRTGGECDAIGDMARTAIHMVTDSVDAFVRRDTELALAVVTRDDVVDGLFGDVKKELIGLLTRHPADAEYAVDLLMISKYLERIADHAVNLAEWVVFSVTGVHKGEAEL
jgi:phosphate transport system protein